MVISAKDSCTCAASVLQLRNKSPEKGSFKVLIRASIKNFINPLMPNIRYTHKAV